MTELKPINLYSASHSNMTLLDALSQYRDHLSGATALLYSPTSCQFALLVGDTLNDTDGQISPEKLASVFEARIFNESYELRWLNQTKGSGIAVLLWDCEDSQAVKDAKPDIQALHTLEQTYILWGEDTEAVLAKGWIRLTAARIEKIDVPISLANTSKARVQLKAREYLAEVGNYGNVAVVEERLLKLEELIIEKSNG